MWKQTNSVVEEWKNETPFVPLIGNLTCKLIHVTTKQLKVFLKYKLMGHKTQQFYFTLRLKLFENILNPFWTQLRSSRVSPPSDMIQPVTDTIVSLRRKWHEAHVIILNMSWTEGHRNKRARGELSRDNDKRDREERAMESPCKEEAERWSGRGRAGDDPFALEPCVSFISHCICQQETQEWLAGVTPLHSAMWVTF